MWELRYERDGFSVRSATKKRRKLPDDHWFFDQPPEVPGSDFFYMAYRDLATCRHPDGAIPWTAAMEYAAWKGLKPDIADLVWAVVSRMDAAERGWRFDQLAAETQGGQGG